MSTKVSVRRIRLHLKSRRTDARVIRTRDRLGDALIALILEKRFDSITVQEVLDRAHVSRSAFYVHYRDMEDLFISDIEEFLEAMSTVLVRHQDKSARLAPVREFFAHVQDGHATLWAALVESEKIHDFLQLALGHFARGIEQRMQGTHHDDRITTRQRAATAHTLAGGLLALLQWWVDHGMKESPQKMDDVFHSLATHNPVRHGRASAAYL